ncbi:MAG: hypothetical protein PF503_17135 [Desulfobacula sp.]|jgi:hypothetical protein|nr:hypothetical protein [Desulfobacula sp.]
MGTVFYKVDRRLKSLINLVDPNKRFTCDYRWYYLSGVKFDKLLSEYPDQIDGFERLGQVYEARGKKQVAADYYQKAADFAKIMPGFDQESVEYYLSKVKK